MTRRMSTTSPSTKPSRSPRPKKQEPLEQKRCDADEEWMTPRVDDAMARKQVRRRRM